MLWSALALGFLGSLHCIGMCGPLVLAYAGGRQAGVSQGLGFALYHAARISVYMAMGALLGGIGVAVRLAGVQEFASIATGVLVILTVVAPQLKLSQSIKHLGGFGAIGRFAGNIRRLYTQQGVGASLVAGAINGLLPCGLVYMAVAGSVLATSYAESVAYMGLFGFGTVPALLLLSLAGASIVGSLRGKLQRAVPVLTLAIGVLFVLRGMSLGIPYISPKLAHENHQEQSCCH